MLHTQRLMDPMLSHAYGGVARPGPTRAYALPSTFPFKFPKWRQCFLVKAIIMNRIMDTRFEVQWKVVAEL